MEKIGFHAYVSGRVQGVWFRSSTQKKATALGLTGWVRNLPDGRVEVMASGSDEGIKALHDWLWEGPVIAKVTDVTCEACQSEDYIDFKVL